MLHVPVPLIPPNFADFWQNRYLRAMCLDPRPLLTLSSKDYAEYQCFDLSYISTDNFQIGGWVLIPKHSPVTRGVIVGHGYGGRTEPDLNLPIPGAALMFPCFRGLSRSRCWPISENPSFHVLHDIDKPDKYILGGCVEDLWLAVSALQYLFPTIAGHIGFLGISFGGGIGALALPWDARIQRAHFNVPSFGNQPLRLQLPTYGSAAAVQVYQREHGHIPETLAYYDAAVAAQYIHRPVHIAAALADPVVTPPGQFSIYNALPEQKQLFVLDWGHAEYPGQVAQQSALMAELQEFFRTL
jgi:cephalosporin-C deacetylase